MKKAYVFRDVVTYYEQKGTLFFISGKDFSPGYSDRQINISSPEFGTEKVISLPGAYNIDIINENLIISCSNPDKTFVYKNNKLIELEFRLHLPGFHSEQTFVCLSDYQKRFGYIEVAKNTLAVLNFFDLPIGFNGINYFYKRNFISKKGDLLGCFSWVNGREIWRLSFSELLKNDNTESYGRMIVHKGKLYFYASADAQNRATFCIDFDSGAVVKKLDNFAGNLFLCENKIFVASGYVIKELDTETLQAIEHDLSDELSKANLQIHWEKSIVTKDGFMFFVDGYFYTTNRFGVIDLVSNKLLWHGNVEIDDGVNNNIQEIKIFDNRLFVHGSDFSLNIFEIPETFETPHSA